MGTSGPRRSVCGAAGAALLVAAGAIHLDLYLTGYRTIPTIGGLFLFQVIVAFVLAVLALAAIWLPNLAGSAVTAAGALFALATLGGYLLSLRVGLFGFREVRTTAGIVSGVIDIAAFAALAAAALPSRAQMSQAQLSRARLSGAGSSAVAATMALARRAVPAIAGVCVVALALLVADVAAGQGGSGPPSPAASGSGGSGQTLKATQIKGVSVLSDAKGHTLYWFQRDTPTASNCSGDCSAYWPPLYGHVKTGAGVTGTVGSITRPDGSTQATFDGHPLYTYIGDTGPGQDSGNNININGGFWYQIKVSG